MPNEFFSISKVFWELKVSDFFVNDEKWQDKHKINDNSLSQKNHYT